MRGKEEANDYRYFPDPDLLPIAISEARIAGVRDNMPELPHVKRARFIEKYELPAYDVDILVADRALADYFEASASETSASPKTTANWIIGELGEALNRENLAIDGSRVSPAALASLLDRIEDGTISGKLA